MSAPTEPAAPAPRGAPALAPAAGRPAWGVQASLIQPHQSAFWLYLTLFAMGGSLFVREQSQMSSLMAAWLLSWALVLAYAVPVAVIVYRLDLFEREPKMVLVAALIWGGIIATSMAAQANDAWLSILGKVASPDLASQWGAAIVGPGVEETLKLAGVVTIFLIVPGEFDGLMDGFVYGAMVGLGFTVVEDVSYFITAVAAVPGTFDQSGPVLDTFLVRVVGGGLYGHVLFTGLTGLGFAYIATRRSAALSGRLWRGGLCIAAGVAAHAIWNSPWMEDILVTSGGAAPSTLQWLEYGAVKGLPFLILLGLLVRLATRTEENTFRAIVAGEPDPWVITEPEITSLRSLRSRRAARIEAGRSRGPAASRALGRLQAAQVEFAMIRSRTDSQTDPALDAQRQAIRAIRSELAVWSAPAAGTVLATWPSPAWLPTHLVPRGGIAAWSTPETANGPVTLLPERTELMVMAQAGDWARVGAENGWVGWVDSRLLMPRS
jgi:RsiW-degrading membrane proteinase PrsW (M82 family)